MVNMKTAILLPSAYRPIHLQECLTSLFNTTPSDQCDVFVSIFRDDRPSMDVVSDFDIAGVTYRDVSEYNLGVVYGQRVLLKAHPDYQFYSISSDDLVYRADWYKNARAALHRMNDYGLVGLNDTHSDGHEYAAHFIVSRDFLIDWHGGVIFPPLYKSWWCDREITDLAKLHNCYTFAEDSVVEHRNHAWGGIEYDQTYRDAEPNYDNDYRLYRYYKENGFPVDWEPILLGGQT